MFGMCARKVDDYMIFQIFFFSENIKSKVSLLEN